MVCKPTSFHRMLIDSFLTELFQSMKEYFFLLGFSQLLRTLEQPHAWNKWLLWHWALNGWTFSHNLGPCDALPWQDQWPIDDCGKFSALKENPQRCPLLVRLHSTSPLFSWDCFTMLKLSGQSSTQMLLGRGAQHTETTSIELAFTLLFTHRQRNYELHCIIAIL